MGFLAGKKALITGVISDRSIAYAIAKAMHREGAELAFTYQNDRFESRIKDLVAPFGSKITLPCDVSNDEEIAQVFETLGKEWGSLDILIHSIAYAPADQLQGTFLESTNREGFRIAHDVSSYSLTALTKAAYPLMKDNKGAILTLSYLGGERSIPSYNVMGLAKASLEANVRYLAASLGPDGVRVNAISAGPIKTLAASGIKGFKKLLSLSDRMSPLKRTVSAEEVGNVAAFLCSDLASGITAEVVHVDAGFHSVAFPGLDEE
jgi:enoyl-[acyl-carrier protein] reductase I